MFRIVVLTTLAHRKIKFVTRKVHNLLERNNTISLYETRKKKHFVRKYNSAKYICACNTLHIAYKRKAITRGAFFLREREYNTCNIIKVLR